MKVGKQQADNWEEKLLRQRYFQLSLEINTYMFCITRIFYVNLCCD